MRVSVLLLLLLLPFASMDDHASVEALQETWRLLALLHLDLGHRQKEAKQRLASENQQENPREWIIVSVWDSFKHPYRFNVCFSFLFYKYFILLLFFY